jgi:hypothetical protein
MRTWAQLPGLSPGGVAVDLVEEVLNVGAGIGQVVLVELEVPVSPVQRPLAAGTSCSGAARSAPGPGRSVLGLPWRTAFQARDGTIGDVELEADLISDMLRHSTQLRESSSGWVLISRSSRARMLPGS